LTPSHAMETLPWLSNDPCLWPSPDSAFSEPNGLLAAGGDLTPERLLNAYSLGIFPWFSDGDPILWWSPSPRAVVIPEQFEASRSLKKLLKKNLYENRINTDFEGVIRACASIKREQTGTWITEDMIQAYITLHRLGWAHSFETWRGTRLVGGLYGLAIGKAFFGESMFSKESNTSKLAFWHLCRRLSEHEFTLLDCQVASDHLFTLGAIEMDRHVFQEHLQTALAVPSSTIDWGCE